MKKFNLVHIFLILGVLMAPVSALTEFTKEGSGMLRTGKSGESQVLKMEEGHVQVNWNEKGAVVDAPANSPFENASFSAIGTLHAIDGKFQSSGAVVFTCSNGDKIFGIIRDVEGVLGSGPTRGGIDLTGGTGGCSGITGTMELKQNPVVQSSQKGTYQGIGIAKVNWKIP